jgi:hypothetical protein
MPEQKPPVDLSLSVRLLPGSGSAETAKKNLLNLAEAIADFSSEQHAPSREHPPERDGREIVNSASAEYKKAIKVFASVQQSTIELELKRRSSQIENSKKEGGSEAPKIQRIRAELDLVKKLQEAGIVVARVEGGGEADFVLLPAPENYDFTKLARHLVEKEESAPIAGETREGTPEGATPAMLIHVPRPTTNANPDRPISSVLKAQVKHLHEAEKKLPLRYRTDIFVKGIQTEGEAARYIREVTEAIHAAHKDAAEQRSEGSRRPRKIKRVIEIAACAEEERPRTKRNNVAKKKSRKK